jgi:hypothetical protein
LLANPDGNSISLTEDRTLASPAVVNQQIARALLASTDSAVIKEVLAGRCQYERGLDFKYLGKPTVEFTMETIQWLAAGKHIPNETIISVVKEAYPTGFKALEDMKIPRDYASALRAAPEVTGDLYQLVWAARAAINDLEEMVEKEKERADFWEGFARRAASDDV